MHTTRTVPMNYSDPYFDNNNNNNNNVKMTGRAFEFPGEVMSILLYVAVILIAAFRNPDPN
jgi:hypothetical protein